MQAGLTTANTLLPTGTARALRLVAASFAYPTLKLAQPLFMGTGAVDVDVSTEQQIALAKDACAAGTTVVQHVYPGLDHSGTVNASLVDSVAFRAPPAGRRARGVDLRGVAEVELASGVVLTPS